jgi:membrane fusion protein (multidrug efflux system)
MMMCAALAMACKGAPKQFQPPPPQVTVLTVKPETIAAHFDYVGQAQASKHIVVRSNVSGYIVDRPYVEGTDVQKGAVLFRIDPTKYRAAYQNALGTLADAKAKLANAKITLARQIPLLAEHAVAQQDVDNAKAAVDQDSADVVAAVGSVENTKKDLDDTEVRALVNGRVGIAWMVLGARVASGTDSLTSLDQVDPIYVTFNPSDQDVLQWRREVAQKRLTLPNGQLQVRVVLSDGTVFPRPGMVNFADTAGDIPQRTAHSAARAVRARGDARLQAYRRDPHSAARGPAGHHRPVRVRGRRQQQDRDPPSASRELARLAVGHQRGSQSGRSGDRGRHAEGVLPGPASDAGGVRGGERLDERADGR